MGVDFPEPNPDSKRAYTIATDWFGEGAARYAYKGVVNRKTSNYEFGEQIVAKKFKDKHAMLVTDWDAQVKIEEKALELAEAWNRAKYVDKIFDVVQSSSSQFFRDETTDTLVKHEEYLRIEPWLGDEFDKWNSNNGWAKAWASSIQAFCHWSYHYTGGKLLFCDAQGIKNYRRYTITDPCIVSQTMYEYGDTDGGLELQHAWFGRHRCNDFCKAAWKMPTKTQMRQGMKKMDVQRGTSYNWDRADHTTKANKNKYTGLNQNITRKKFLPKTKRVTFKEAIPKTTRFNNPNAI